MLSRVWPETTGPADAPGMALLLALYSLGIPWLFGRLIPVSYTHHGIGLSIVKSVIEAHHGSVRLAASGPGATFVIDLPAEETA